MRIFGELAAELGRRFLEVAAAVQAVMPFPQADILDEAQTRLILGQLPREEAFRIPAVEDVADVEDDGGWAIRGCGVARHRAEAKLQDEDISVDFAELTTPSDRVAVVVTEPLTRDEAWIEFAPGELKVFANGAPVG